MAQNEQPKSDEAQIFASEEAVEAYLAAVVNQGDAEAIDRAVKLIEGQGYVIELLL